MRHEERIEDREEAIRQGQDGHQARIWTALPGVVVSVNLEAQTVTVQPTIRARITDPGGGSRLADLPVCPDVPIVWPRGGGFALTFPVTPGDEVLLVFACRAIDSWWSEGGVGTPVEARMHDLSDGFAIPGPTSQPRRLSGVSAEAVQLRSDDGATFVELTDSGEVNVKAPADVTVEAGGSATVKASSEVVLEAPIIRLKGLIDLNGIAWATHVHGGSSTPSGPPV